MGAFDLSGLRPPRSKDLRGGLLATAGLLLAAGADPNAGYLWHGLPSPFTVLTGVFGEGELGPLRQPRHPHSLPLGRLLLEAGADANDGQALYNRMFEPGDDHLELLFEFGLGRGDGGPWRARLGDAVDSPAELVRAQLRWAIIHDLGESVRLLAVHGVDLGSPFDDGHTPTATALSTATRLCDLLVSAGAPPADLDGPEAFVAAALNGDRAAIDRLAPEVVEKVRAQRPGLMVWAAANGRTKAVALLDGLGFDVNAPGAGATLPSSSRGILPCTGRRSRRRGHGRTARQPRRRPVAAGTSGSTPPRSDGL